MLRGPDPEPFRTKVWGARYYVDPLPADDIAPATKEKWPSVTTIKKAWSKPFRKKLPTGETVPLDALWAAEFIADNLAAVTALGEDRGAIVTLCATAPARRLNAAADRGTGVHTLLEDIAGGVVVDDALLDDAVRPFAPACRSFVEDWSPVFTASEVIAYNREIGFAGTADSILHVALDDSGRRSVALVDWKSRSGAHGAYEEEIAQIGGYSLAEYLIVRSPLDGTPMRIEPPKLDTGLIVSLSADGYQLYPVELTEAQAAFRMMHDSWVGHRQGQKAARKARGNPLLVPPSDAELTKQLEDSVDLFAPTTIDVDPGPTAEAIATHNAAADAVEDLFAESTPAPAPEPEVEPPAAAEGEVDQRCPRCKAAPGDEHTEDCLPSRQGAINGRGSSDAEVHAARLEWLRERITAIVEAGGGGDLAREWSMRAEGIPTLKNGGPRDAAEVEVVSEVCCAVEKTHGLPFPDEDPGVAVFVDALKREGMIDA